MSRKTYDIRVFGETLTEGAKVLVTDPDTGATLTFDTVVEDNVAVALSITEGTATWTLDYSATTELWRGLTLIRSGIGGGLVRNA